MRNPVAAILSSLLLLACLFVPRRSAVAAGTATPSTREPVEEDGKWKLKFTIGIGSPPALPHVPMLFVFTPTVLYERSLTDKTGDKPIINRIPLQNQQPINESLDVGFSDGTGKVFPITKFDFVVRREHGFEAGEYDLKIKREGDGVQIGQTIKLTLKGDNVVVDRRAMVFAGEKERRTQELPPPTRRTRRRPTPLRARRRRRLAVIPRRTRPRRRRRSSPSRAGAAAASTATRPKAALRRSPRSRSARPSGAAAASRARCLGGSGRELAPSSARLLLAASMSFAGRCARRGRHRRRRRAEA